MIIDKLINKIKETGNPSVIGLDPRIEYIPPFILEKNFKKFENYLEAVSQSIFEFNREIIDNIFDIIPAIKPQIAMYERYGIEGLKAYLMTIEYAKKKDIIIIGDIKRGDISSTAEAYSEAHIGINKIKEKEFEIFKQDFITVNPYMGSDSINPFLKDCKKYDKGLFILAKTSNPNSAEVQDLLIDGVPLYEKIGELIEKWGDELIGLNGYSSIGAVVGATHKEQAKRLRDIMPKTFFLVPGYGAQGGKAEDLSVCFDKNGIGAIINSSRGIIAKHLEDNYFEKDFAKFARKAALEMKEDLRRCI